MSRISQSQMAKLFRRLATSYSAGIDIRTTLSREIEIGSPTHRSKSQSLADGVNDGMSLAEAMKGLEGYFPELAISVVRAGEEGGRLEESFSRLADHYHNLVAFRNRLFTALAWPMFELVAAILLVGLMIAICDWVVGQMGNEPIDWFWMGSTTGNVLAYFFLVGLFLTSIVVLIRGTTLGWFGDYPMKIARRIPLIGKTIECLALSRFAWTVSVAENAGMNPIDVASLALRSTENYFYQQHEQLIGRKLVKGESYLQAFQATDAFPEELLIYVDNGETSGQLAEAMDRASVEFQNRADTNLKLLGTIGFGLMITLVAVLVGAIVIFAMQQYLNMLNNIANW